MTNLTSNLVRLIITAPTNTSFSSYRVKVEGVFIKFLPGPKNYDAYQTFIATGLPFHLPLSFSRDEAQALAAALIKVDCTVRIVPE